MNNDEEKIVSLSGRKKSDTKGSKNIEKKTEQTDLVYCSFCNRPNTQVVKMVKGPDVNICSECTIIAVQYLILDDRMPSGEAQKILDAFWRKI